MPGHHASSYTDFSCLLARMEHSYTGGDSDFTFYTFRDFRPDIFGDLQLISDWLVRVK